MIAPPVFYDRSQHRNVQRVGRGGDRRFGYSALLVRRQHERMFA
jgi:hypothetical protein